MKPKSRTTTYRERNVRAVLHRGTKVMWTRYYADTDTAIPRAIQLAIREGQPRDSVEFSHKITEKWLGNVKLHVNNHITTDFVWEKPMAHPDHQRKVTPIRSRKQAA